MGPNGEKQASKIETRKSGRKAEWKREGSANNMAGKRNKRDEIGEACGTYGEED
jgi:hypothetical protein